MLDLKNEIKIENAITFLTQKIVNTGKNPKPVIFHSIKVGIMLHDLGYDEKIFITGLLHDLLEDSDTTATEINDLFGNEVSTLVSSLTFDRTTSDKKQRYLENFDRITKAGNKALIVKSADLIDNSKYYHLSRDQEEYDLMIFKIKHFLKNSKQYIGNESIWNELKSKVKKLKTDY